MAATKTSTTTLITGFATTTTTTPSTSTSTTTAPTTVSQPSGQQITTDEEIARDTSGRLTPTVKTGLGEDNRSVTQDKRRLNTAQQATQTIVVAQRTQTLAAQTSEPISPTDAPQNKVSTILAQEAAISSPKAQTDVTRAIQKNQRTCNHQYSLITKKCNFCGKNRSSHVYDQ